MNWRKIARSIGFVLCAESALLLLPMVVSLCYKESILPFIITALIALVPGVIMLLIKPGNRPIYSGEGFTAVTLSWLLISLIGAFPFTISGSIPSYIDALFETISGFTTTGASILEDIEVLPMGILFWRSFTHWIGGMGVLVFILAVIPQANAQAMHLMRAEIPGPSVDKLVPKTRQTALYLYGIYVVLTVLEMIFLLCGGMSLFDSAVNAFATAGTGGFSVRQASIAAYDSVYIEAVIAVFMLLFGVNFNLYFLLLMKELKLVIKNEELIVYACIIVSSTLAISVNMLRQFGSLATSLRYSFFQVSSIVTTTGFATCDFDKWSTFSKLILFLLMFCGSCGGSTCGALKVSRIIILFKRIGYNIQKLIYPNSVKTMRLNGKRVDNETISGVTVFFIAYMFFLALGSLLVSLDGFSFETTVSAVVACIGNIGPGFDMVGPSGSFAGFSVFSKLVLSLEMLLGRLEIFPLLIAFSPLLHERVRKAAYRLKRRNTVSVEVDK